MSEWWQRSAPNEIRIEPWLHAEATRYLESLLRPEMAVFEHGAGGSTLWLAQRVKRIVSVESKAEWLEVVRKLAPKNVEMMFCEGLFDNPEETFDMMLVDGDPVDNRRFYLDHADLFVKPGGWVMLDNSNRPEYSLSRESMRRRCQFWVTFHFHHPIVTYMETEFYKLRGGLE